MAQAKIKTADIVDQAVTSAKLEANVTAIITHAATGKTTPVDADEMPLVDSAASNVLKKLTWANIKATLKTYFDTIYGSSEYDNGNATGTATIDWSNGRRQYVTLTGNTTLSFTNPVAGENYTLHIAGAFTPTFPATIRWPNNILPTSSVTAGRKDIWMFIYSGKESLYDGTVALNFLIT